MYQPDENKTLLKSSMLQCLFSHIGNFHRTHTENRGVELIGDRVFKAVRNTLDSVRRTEHRAYGCAVNAVFNVRNTCVTPRHICRKLRISGIYISEVISSYLCSDQLPVRIYTYCRIRRFKPFNIIAKRNSLGCYSSVTAKRKSQSEYACKSKQPVGTLGKSQNQVVFFLQNVQNIFRKMQRLFFVAVLILNQVTKTNTFSCQESLVQILRYALTSSAIYF